MTPPNPQEDTHTQGTEVTFEISSQGDSKHVLFLGYKNKNAHFLRPNTEFPISSIFRILNTLAAQLCLLILLKDITGRPQGICLRPHAPKLSINAAIRRLGCNLSMQSDGATGIGFFADAKMFQLLSPGWA